MSYFVFKFISLKTKTRDTSAFSIVSRNFGPISGFCFHYS
jgi:hypothetical protein